MRDQNDPNRPEFMVSHLVKSPGLDLDKSSTVC